MTDRERRLADAYEGSEWQDVLAELGSTGGEFKDWVEVRAEDLISQVLAGTLSVDELRAQVARANELDREVVVSGIVVGEATDDGAEALRRRFVHHVGRTALEATKSSHRRWVTRSRRVGGGGQETVTYPGDYYPDLSRFGSRY